MSKLVNRYALLAALIAALVIGSFTVRIEPAKSSTPVCAISGNLSTLYGSAAVNARVSYSYGRVQVPSGGGVIIPGGSACSVFTDSSGNLPSSGNCTSFVQGAIMVVTVGSGSPVQIQIPVQSTADLSTLILANSDPPSLVSQIAVQGCSSCTVTNPGTGAIGTATINLGGTVLPVPTVAGQALFTDSSGSSAAWATFSGDVTASASTVGDISVNSANAFTGRGTNPTITQFSVNGVVNLAAPVNGTAPTAGGIYITDAYASGSGSTTLNDPGGHFTSSMVGWAVVMEHAGTEPCTYAHNDFGTTIASYVSSTQVTLTAAPTVAFSLANPTDALIAPIDTTPIQAAVTAANNAGACLYVPTGYWVVDGAFVPNCLIGDGPTRSVVAQYPPTVPTTTPTCQEATIHTAPTGAQIHYSNVGLWYDGFSPAPAGNGAAIYWNHVWTRRGEGVWFPTTGGVTMDFGVASKVLDSQLSGISSFGGNYIDLGEGLEVGPSAGSANFETNGPDTVRGYDTYLHDDYTLGAGGGIGFEVAVNSHAELTAPVIRNEAQSCVQVEQASAKLVGGSTENCADWRATTTATAYAGVTIHNGEYDEIGVSHFANDDTAWRANVPYLTGDYIVVPGNPSNEDNMLGTYFTAGAGCTTGFVQPAWPTSGSVVDGDCTWTYGGKVWLWAPGLVVTGGDLVVPSLYNVQDTGIASDPVLYLYKVTTAGSNTLGSTEVAWSGYLDYGATPTDSNTTTDYSLVHVPEPGTYVPPWSNGAGASTTYAAAQYITPATPNGYLYKSSASCTPGSSFSPGTTLGAVYTDGVSGCSWTCEGYYRIPSGGLARVSDGTSFSVGTLSSVGSTFYRQVSGDVSSLFDATYYGDAVEAAGSRSSVGASQGYYAGDVVRGGHFHYVQVGVQFSSTSSPVVQGLTVDKFDYGIIDELPLPNMTLVSSGNEQVLNNVLTNGDVDGILIAQAVNTTNRGSATILNNVVSMAAGTPYSIYNTVGNLVSGSVMVGTSNVIAGQGQIPNFTLLASSGTSGYAPGISGCASSPYVGSTNNRAGVTATSTATCTETFSTKLPFQSTPYCIVTDENTPGIVANASISAKVLTWSGTSGHFYFANCFTQ